MPSAVVPTILVTRPRPFADELAAATRAEGWNPAILDVLTTKPATNPLKLKQQLEKIFPVEQAIFTSRSAVSHAFRIFEPIDFNGSGIAAMGRGSARELEQFGFTDVLLPERGSNSEALLRLDAFSANNAGSVIIFCAPGGRDLLQRELGERGWHVHNAEIYERVVQAPLESTLADIRAADQLVTVCTSGTAIDACYQQLPADIWQQIINQPWMVISERLETLARNVGVTKIYRSPGPGNSAIVEAIRGIV